MAEAPDRTEAQPNDAGLVLKSLLHEIWSLKVDWEIYRQLYGTSEQSVGELNRRTGRFFGTIEHVFPDRVILAVANLVDADDRVLSFHRALRELALPQADPRLGAIRKQLKALKKHCRAMIEHRNQRIAHKDMAVILATEKLDSVTVQMVADAITMAQGVYDAMSVIHDGSNASWDMHGFTGVTELMRVLKAGNDRLDAERKAQMRP